jgi:hypothetical protein
MTVLMTKISNNTACVTIDITGSQIHNLDVRAYPPFMNISGLQRVNHQKVIT